MNDRSIREALAALGKRLAANSTIELLVVGGAAGLLNGELAGANTTGDVDVLLVVPPKEWDQIQDAAAQVGKEMDLPANWLNRDAGLYAESLPNDWNSRKVDVGHFGILQIWAIGRMDLIAMKFYSHRPQDREHLAQMNVTENEREFVLLYLEGISNRENVGKSNGKTDGQELEVKR